MKLRLLPVLAAAAIMVGCATPPEAVHLEEANVLPLELNDRFVIRKIKRFYFEPLTFETTPNEMVNFERNRYSFGAVNNQDIRQRAGNYFDIFWRARDRADVTVRLEYRQAGLGNTVWAQEIQYPQARGSFKSPFQVTGDEYLEGGRVTSWRVLLIVDNRIVAFRQSFLWR
jgi:hypothetical protein